MHLEEEEKGGCFAFNVLQVYCYNKWYVALSQCVMGWSAVCDCGFFLIIITYLLKQEKIWH